MKASTIAIIAGTFAVLAIFASLFKLTLIEVPYHNAFILMCVGVANCSFVIALLKHRKELAIKAINNAIETLKGNHL